MNELDVPIAQLYQNEHSNFVHQLGDMKIVVESVPQLASFGSGMQKSRQKVLPPIPKSIKDIVITEEWAKCDDKKRRFLLFHSSNMLIFASDLELEVLSKCKHW